MCPVFVSESKIKGRLQMKLGGARRHWKIISSNEFMKNKRIRAELKHRMVPPSEPYNQSTGRSKRPVVSSREPSYLSHITYNTHIVGHKIFFPSSSYGPPS